MTVTVLLFASYADALGSSAITLDLAPGATVRDLVDRLQQMRGADRLPPAPLIAVNHSYASGNQILSPTDEIAVIPPVAGG